MNKLNDKMIREVLINRLNTYKNIKIKEEVTVPSGLARADVVAVNGLVTGYEIKSDVDSLVRLGNQIKEYDRFFEKNFIVVGKKYYNKVLNLVPDYWGIIVIEYKKGKLDLNYIRQAKMNPNLNFNDFLFFLSSDEIKYIAKRNRHFLKLFTKTQIQKMMKQYII